MSRKRKRGTGRGAGTISIGVIVVAFLIVMGTQIIRLKQKDDAYASRQQELQQQYEEETERANELGDLEEYMKSDQYIEDTAKSKLGLTYDSEIIFKESEE